MNDQFPITLSVGGILALRFDEIKQRFHREDQEIAKTYVVGRLRELDSSNPKYFTFKLQDDSGEIDCAAYTDSDATETSNARVLKSIQDGDYVRLVANLQNSNDGTLLVVTHCIRPSQKEIDFFSS